LVLAVVSACTPPASVKDVVIGNQDPESRLIHAVVGSDLDLGWFTLEGSTQAVLPDVPVSPSGLEIGVYDADCLFLSTTGYPMTSANTYRISIDRGQTVLEQEPRPLTDGEFLPTDPCPR
jgi:hypothetical protein